MYKGTYLNNFLFYTFQLIFEARHMTMHFQIEIDTGHKLKKKNSSREFVTHLQLLSWTCMIQLAAQSCQGNKRRYRCPHLTPVQLSNRCPGNDEWLLCLNYSCLFPYKFFPFLNALSDFFVGIETQNIFFFFSKKHNLLVFIATS